MTIYTVFFCSRNWDTTTTLKPPYEEIVFTGAQAVPIFGQIAIPEHPRGTIVGTYGITGSLDNQWLLKLLEHKAFAQGYAVVLFDWRAHGRTAQLSATLTSDGLYEGEDFVRIAAQAKARGCPAPFWFTGFSLGGQLALWAVKAAQDLGKDSWQIGLETKEIGGAAVICPSLDSNRSLSYLVKAPLGRYIERAIAQQLQKLAWQIYETHPTAIDPAAIERVNSIWGFDHELVIAGLGFASVEDYYTASSALHLLPHLQKPTLIIYAEDDPLFDPTIVSDLKAACASNPYIDLLLTSYGGHVGYLSSRACQQRAGDPDVWWAWNRVLEWFEQQQACNR